MSDVTVTVAPIPGKRNRFNVYIHGEMVSFLMNFWIFTRN